MLFPCFYCSLFYMLFVLSINLDAFSLCILADFFFFQKKQCRPHPWHYFLEHFFSTLWLPYYFGLLSPINFDFRLLWLISVHLTPALWRLFVMSVNAVFVVFLHSSHCASVVSCCCFHGWLVLCTEVQYGAERQWWTSELVAQKMGSLLDINLSYVLTNLLLKWSKWLTCI